MLNDQVRSAFPGVSRSRMLPEQPSLSVSVSVRPHIQAQGSTRAVVKCLLGAIILTGLLACSSARAPSPQTTAGSANVSLLQLLQDTEHSDRLNAKLYTRSAPSLDHYYNLKADQVNDVMHRLQRGEDVPSDDINHALDNSLASTFGVPVY